MPGALLAFACWEAVLFAAAIALVGTLGRSAEERCLLILGVEITLESSLAGLFSCSRARIRPRLTGSRHFSSPDLPSLSGPREEVPLQAFPATLGPPSPLPCPLCVAARRRVIGPAGAARLSHPVDEIDSINYLHYLIEWMANRSTPYNFATYYVAFWELSFLPAWVVTQVDLFFPLLALKSLVLLALAAWLLGREFELRAVLLAATVLGVCLLRHLWFEAAGVSTLKTDTLHGVGFLLLALVAVRAARRPLARSDAGPARCRNCLRSRQIPRHLHCAGGAGRHLVASPRAGAGPSWRHREGCDGGVHSGSRHQLAGHYYLHHVLEFGSPFYPVQINLGPIHLPGQVCRSFRYFDSVQPAQLRTCGVRSFCRHPESSVAGLMFPLVLGLDPSCSPRGDAAGP